MTEPSTATIVMLATASAGLVATAVVPPDLQPLDYTALTIAIGALLGTIFTGIVGIIVALRTGKTVQEVSAKADVITGHVNSAATAASAKIAYLEQRLDQLAVLLADSKETARALAHATAQSLTPHAAEIKQTVADHDAWEREERRLAEAALAENTRLTKEVLASVKPKEPSV